MVDKCDIIDIAEKELKNIDTTQIDNEFQQLQKNLATKVILEEIKNKKCKEKDIQMYKDIINDPDILDIRKEGQYLFIKTKKDIETVTLGHILQIKDKYINKVPIKGKYQFYFINSKDCYKKQKKLNKHPKHISRPQDKDLWWDKWFILL